MDALIFWLYISELSWEGLGTITYFSQFQILVYFISNGKAKTSKVEHLWRKSFHLVAHCSKMYWLFKWMIKEGVADENDILGQIERIADSDKAIEPDKPGLINEMWPL